jgi:hypothetical protein
MTHQLLKRISFVAFVTLSATVLWFGHTLTSGFRLWQNGKLGGNFMGPYQDTANPQDMTLY